MKTSAKWGVLAVFVATGVVGFACGGGGGETPPPNTGTASASGNTMPPSSAPASSSAEPTAATTAAPVAAPPLVVAAMKLTGPKLKGVEMKDDGSVVNDKKAMGKFVGAELQNGSGATLIAVAADGTIKMDGMQKTMKFNDKDELEIEGGAKMVVADDGSVKLLNPDGKADKDSGKVKFTGFKPTARRAATVLVMAMLMPHVTSGSPAEVTPAKKK